MMKLPIVLSLLLSIGACAGVSRTPSLSPQDRATILNIDSMTLLPIISDTPLPSESRQEILANVYDHVGLELALKGYVFEKADHFSSNNTFTPEEVAKMGVEEIALLGPEKSQYLVLCILQELNSSFFLIAQSASSGISAMIIDKYQKKVIWKNKDTSRSTTGLFLPPAGLLGMLIMDEESAAIYGSIRGLFSTIPEKPMN